MDNKLQDILTFRTMITPVIVQIFFWLGLVGCVLSGIGSMFTGSFFAGVGIILVGPLIVRIYCELIIVIFNINNTLTEVRNHQQKS